MMAPAHGPTTTGRLALSSLIFGLNFVVQGVGGLWTGSLGLVSDSLENLNDAVVNLLSLGSIRLANRREPCDQWNYGWHRLEIFNTRSEEHTSELQSLRHLVCRLLLE